MKCAPQPVTLLMVSPEELDARIERSVARAIAAQGSEVLDLEQAIRHVRLSERTLQRRVDQGRLTVISRKPFRVLRAELDRLRTSEEKS